MASIYLSGAGRKVRRAGHGAVRMSASGPTGGLQGSAHDRTP
ncbi:hypothetical protein FM106_00095 [Brachybacterium faecium]|nr:hypothetical protein FM106_00095 [Brachybacterium faecium]